MIFQMIHTNKKKDNLSGCSEDRGGMPLFLLRFITIISREIIVPPILSQ